MKKPLLPAKRPARLLAAREAQAAHGAHEAHRAHGAHEDHGTHRAQGTSDVTSLAVALAMESLPASYAAWLELRQKRAAAAQARERERERLLSESQLLLGAVAAARDLPTEAPETKPKPKPKSKPKKGAQATQALVPAELDPLAQYQAQAQAEVAAKLAALDARGREEEAALEAQDQQLRAQLRSHVQKHLLVHKPSLSLRVHLVGKTHALVQASGIGDEDAALLMWVLHHKLASRWGFFSDEAIEDLSRGAPRLYPDLGHAEPWPESAEAEDLALYMPGDFCPARLQIPLPVPHVPFPRFRLVHQGPVAEVEARHEGKGYDKLLAREDLEKLTGYLLRLKLAGQLGLELHVG
jgi:hypothetical protein